MLPYLAVTLTVPYKIFLPEFESDIVILQQVGSRFAFLPYLEGVGLNKRQRE